MPDHQPGLWFEAFGGKRCVNGYYLADPHCSVTEAKQDILGCLRSLTKVASLIYCRGWFGHQQVPLLYDLLADGER